MLMRYDAVDAHIMNKMYLDWESTCGIKRQWECSIHDDVLCCDAGTGYDRKMIFQFTLCI